MLNAIQLHRIIKDRANKSRAIPLHQLAEEMNMSPEHFTTSINILKDMGLIEVDERKGIIKLTITGRLANIDSL